MCLSTELRNYVEILSLQAKHFSHIVNRDLTHSMSSEETKFKLEEKHINVAE